MLTLVDSQHLSIVWGTFRKEEEQNHRSRSKKLLLKALEGVVEPLVDPLCCGTNH